MPASDRLELVALRVATAAGEVRTELDPPPRAVAGALVVALRHALDGAGLPEGHRVALELRFGGESFVLERGARPRFVRLSGADEEVLASGDDMVTEFVARLAGASEPLARRLIASCDAAERWLRSERDEPGALHAALGAQLEPASAALGGRMRSLLQRAHALLRESTEALAPGRAEPLTPDDLAGLREEVASLLGAAADGIAKLSASAAVADSLASRLAERRKRMDEFLRAEQVSRRLEQHEHLIAGTRRRIERARAARELARPGAAPDPARIERMTRERAEREAAAARDDAASARAALDEQQARAPEREAIAAWIARLRDMQRVVGDVDEARSELAAADREAEQAESAAALASEQESAATAELERMRAALASFQATPEEAARAHEEAARAARLAEEVRRLAVVRDRLRDGARDLQNRKLDAQRAEEALESARREIDWARSSPHPVASSSLPDVPSLVAARDARQREVEAASESLLEIREDLRRRTAALGNAAYLSPELLEAEAREKAGAASRFGAAGLDRAAVESRIAELEALAVAARARREAASRALDEVSLRRLGARASVARADGVPEALRSREALARALAEAESQERERRTAAESARRAADRAAARLLQADEALRSARAAEASAARRMVDLSAENAPLREAGFASWDEVEEARLPDERLRELEAELAEHEALQRLAEDGEARGREDMLLPRADPAQAELMRSLLIHALDGARVRHARLASRLPAYDARLDALDEIVAELDHVEQVAGLGESADRSVAFEDRVREGLVRRVLARAEGRLARWARPWTLSLAPAAGARALRVLDAETGAEVLPSAALEQPLLPLALAIELALAGEPVSAALLIVEGASAWPGDAAAGEDVAIVRG